MHIMELYRRAQEEFDVVLGDVRPDQWDSASACAGWTVRDVVGHVVWGQRQMRARALDEEYDERAGAPGALTPGVLAGGDPVEVWREARAVSVRSLTDEALARQVSIVGIGEVPLAGVLNLLITDHVAHTWDIAHGLGKDIRLHDELIDAAWDWARSNIVRRPGFFAPAETPPAGADRQTQMLAFLGRAPWVEVSA